MEGDEGCYPTESDKLDWSHYPKYEISYTYINKTVGHRRYLWTKYNIPIMLCFPPPLRLGPKDIKILIPPEAVS